MVEQKVKITTRTGKILTIIILSQDKERITGTDKFGVPVIIKIEDIDSMIPITAEKEHETDKI
jgi:hypothetical protein